MRSFGVLSNSSACKCFTAATVKSLQWRRSCIEVPDGPELGPGNLGQGRRGGGNERVSRRRPSEANRGASKQDSQGSQRKIQHKGQEEKIEENTEEGAGREQDWGAQELKAHRIKGRLCNLVSSLSWHLSTRETTFAQIWHGFILTFCYQSHKKLILSCDRKHGINFTLFLKWLFFFFINFPWAIYLKLHLLNKLLLLVTKE